MQWTTVRIDGNVPLACQRVGEGRYVAICEPLQLTLQADTWGELLEDFTETIDAMFSDLLASNDLLQFLKDHGWRVTGTLPSKPENVRFDMPFFPAMIGANGPQGTVHQ